MLSKNGIFCTSDDEKFLIFLLPITLSIFVIFFLAKGGWPMKNNKVGMAT